jgi:hypothetical protein
MVRGFIATAKGETPHEIKDEAKLQTLMESKAWQEAILGDEDDEDEAL